MVEEVKQVSKVKTIPIAEIRENPIALRAVNKQSEAFIGLVDSIKNIGLMNAISVRLKKDEETGKEYYELADGLHRFTACVEAGLKEINATIISLDDDKLIEGQIMANIHKVETSPVQYAKALRKILSRDPYMTEASLAQRLAKSPSWIRDRLSINRISNAKVLELINEGKIPLSNAYSLAKLPEGEVENFVDRAMTMKPTQFAEDVANRVKEVKEADRQGKDATAAVFAPTSFLQKMKDIKEESETGKIGPILTKGLKTSAEGFKMAIAWVLHLDPESVAVQKAQFDERQALKKAQTEERAKAKAEKAAKIAEEKAKEAAAAAAEAAEVSKK